MTDAGAPMLVRAETIVSDGLLLSPGWISTAGGVVTGAGSGEPHRPADRDLGDAVVAPAFVDVHVHGGGGGSFPGGDPDEAHIAAALHRGHGTAVMLASLVTAAPDDLRSAVERLAPLVDDGTLAGLHLEGPWLAAARRGAHEARLLRDPDLGELDAVLAAGRGSIRMITLAPERPGALAAIRRIADAGVIAAIGHTDATYDQIRQAVDAGATVATHLFNAMRPVHHREPGPVVALLEDPRVTVELVMDGDHLHPAAYRLVTGSTTDDRVVLVTDAIAAAGMPDGRFRLGALDVDVDRGVARLAGTDTIAGSTATMDRVFKEAVTAGGPDRPTAIRRAVLQTSTNPARLLGLRDRALGIGQPADVVVLGPDLRLRTVVTAGRWPHSA